MRRVSLRISGQVQGVFYRRDSQREAQKLGLSGFVLNQSDGSVYAEAEGQDENIGAFIRWCRRGPPNAVVVDVKVEELAAHFDGSTHSTSSGQAGSPQVQPNGLLNERLSEEGFEVRY